MMTAEGKDVVQQAMGPRQGDEVSLCLGTILDERL